MTDPIADWHATRNAEVTVQHAARAHRFGLQPLTPPSHDQPAIIRHLATRTAWAWQPGTGLPTETREARVGIAGNRLHLGHLSLARDISWLQGKGYSIAFVGRPSRSADTGLAMQELIQRVKQFGGHEPSRMIDLDSPAVRPFEDQVLSALTLGRMRQVYGWDADTSLRLLQDAVAMMSFFLYPPGEAPGVALVDAGQAPHTALMKTVARRIAASTPHVAYRRLVPDLRRRFGRASVHEPDSTIFLDESPDVIRQKFMATITGGRASADEQRTCGGDLAACPAFEMIELLCSPDRATAAARRCRAGDVLCRDCKMEHADEVVAGFHPTDLRHVALGAGISPSVPAALLTASQTLHRPPPRNATALESEIAGYAGVTPEQVVVSHGTTEVLDWIMREQTADVHAALATSPTFELYEQLAVRNGLRFDQVAWDRPTLRHDLTALAEAVTDEHVALVVDVPHTVSGTSVSLPDLVASVVPLLSGGAKLIIDNVYGEFMAHPLALTSQLLEERDELVVCRSLSKAHCLLGARVGYVVTNAAYADRLRRHQLPYGVNSLASAAAHASLRDHAGLLRNIAANRQAYTLLTGELDRRHLSYTRSEANFLLIDLGDRHDQVLALLRARGLRFRDGARWRLPAMIQVHLIDEATVAPLVRALRDLR